MEEGKKVAREFAALDSLPDEECTVELNRRIEEFLEYGKGTDSAKALSKMLENRGSIEVLQDLKKSMNKRLEFGTAGMRGKMGVGYNAMNDLVIIQTSQGLAVYLESLSLVKSQGVVIGYDHRHNSKKFAQLAAVAFLQRGFKVYIFSNITPTPFVPYAVRKSSALIGIMVTASHNPKNDNGYKVYWSNGAQIKPPHDKYIQEMILQNLKPWSEALDVHLVMTSELSFDPLAEINVSYYRDLVTNCKVSPDVRERENKSEYKICYSSLHGVSHTYLKKAFQVCGFKNCIPVKEHMIPDPEFPTVKFPNPEEPDCLDIPCATANRNGCSLIVINDPDADRLAVAEIKKDGEWKVFSGNEVGALLGYYLWNRTENIYKLHPENCFMVSSTVSSKILRSISKKEGFQFIETLTGFKWMANIADELVNEGKKLVFAFEEAIGYMCGPMVFDKDGIQSAMHLSTLAYQAHSNGETLSDILNSIYEQYGFHYSTSSYFVCHDPVAIKNMFDSIRSFETTDDPILRRYPRCLESDENEFSVVGIRDLTIGFDSTTCDHLPLLPVDEKTQMITFYLSNNIELTLRTSGTEPKIKYYAEAITYDIDGWPQATADLHKVIEIFTTSIVKPKQNNFKLRN